jgi:hypothetical protein
MHWLGCCFGPRFGRSALLAVCASLLCCLGCGAGRWGTARHYEPLSGEEAAAEGAQDFDPVMVGRFFETWAGKRVSVFGVVLDHTLNASGQAELLLSLRVLQDRNLCQSASEDSCLVTVSETEFGNLNARVNLLPGELAGEHRLVRGSLVRIIGSVSKAPHPETGNYVILANYYRHWPPKYFVTTAARTYMTR